MSFADLYLSKLKSFSPRIQISPKEDLKFIVVVPCYREPQIISTIDSLYSAAIDSITTEIIVVVNSSEKDDEKTIQFNRSTSKELKDWSCKNTNSNFRLFVIEEPRMPGKFAGVGLARKTGMDEAIYRFNQLDKKDGVIISFDADSKCDKNFFAEIEAHYNNFPETNGTTVYFEHPLKGNEFEQKIYDAIAQYELHLRYFVHAVRYTLFPYSFHTVGSCFNFRAWAYVKQGGMNKRQGGEDFYFLHKIIPLGNFHEINSTRVIPSPRASGRVPFGTGPMVKKIIDNEEKSLETYSFESFEEIKKFFMQVPDIYDKMLKKEFFTIQNLSSGIKSFLEKEKVNEAIKEAFDNSASLFHFKKRIFAWFNAFKLIKCLNFLHEGIHEKNNVQNEAKNLLDKKEIHLETDNLTEILRVYRKLDRAGEGLNLLQK